MSEQQIMDLELPKLSHEQMYQALHNHIRDAYDGFISGLKPSTGKTYGWIVLKFLVLNNNINKLKQYNLTQWVKYTEENFDGLSSSTVSLRVAAVKSFFDYLIRSGERKSNPLDGYEVERKYKPYNSRVILSWEQIKQLKQITDPKLKMIFEAAYYHNSPITELDITGSVVDYQMKKMGRLLGIPELKYSDITASRKKFHAICPVTGQELEMIEDNWAFIDGLLQAKR